MPVVRFDHASVPTDHPEEMMAFYESMGFTILDADAFLSGERRIFSIAFGDNKMNVHGPDFWPREDFTLRGPTAKPGCGDLCFVWDGTVEEVQEMLAKAGVEPVAGPVPRYGGRNGGASSSTSIYIVDPDKNLIEFMVYDK